MIVGTPTYFAPEVLRGAKASPASDLWALGVVLYEMVTGRLPFHGKTLIETANSIMNDEPPALPARVPAGLAGIIQRCLAKDPKHRYRAGGEVAAALEAVDSDSGPKRAALLGQGDQRKQQVLAWIGALALVVAVGVGLFALRDRLFPSAASRAGTIRSLAVLPLANLSGDPSQEYFADGMTEELITSLAPLPDLKVISRTSVMRYKGTNKPVPQIARELGVDGIIEGSVTRSGNRVRVTAQLLDAAQDKHLWAHSYERTMDEVLTLQGDLARDIAQEIQIQLAPGMADLRRENHPLNTQAYELYLKGRYELAKLTPESLKNAKDDFQQAIVLDPDDARFHSGMADAYVIEGQVLSSLPLDVAMPRAKEAASKALALDPNLAQPHASYAIALFFVDWDWKGAGEHARKSIELDPGYSLGHLIYSVILGAEGRFDEAIRENRRALELDPLSIMNNWNLANTLSGARHYDEARAQGRRALELFPDADVLRQLIPVICDRQGDYQGAIDAARQWWPESEGGQRFVNELATATAASGMRGYYGVWVKWLKTSTNVNASYRLAQAYARLGETDKAFTQLQRALTNRVSDLLWITIDPCFDAMHGDPRYTEIVRRVGVPPAS